MGLPTGGWCDPHWAGSEHVLGHRSVPRVARMTQLDPVLVELLERCRRDHVSWINGDGSNYELPDDGSILGAVGGYSLGGADTGARQRSVAAQWLSGSGSVEFVNGGVADGFAWLVMIERATVHLVDDPHDLERRWDVRSTEIFRRSGRCEWIGSIGAGCGRRPPAGCRGPGPGRGRHRSRLRIPRSSSHGAWSCGPS